MRNAESDATAGFGIIPALATAMGFYGLLGGLVSFLGWVLDVPRLSDWNGNGIPTQPNTAVAATVAGAALILLVLRRHRAAAPLGLLAAAIGATALFENLSGLSLGIDTLMMFDRPWGLSDLFLPGRIGPPGSTSLVLIGTGLYLSAANGRARRVAPALGLLASSIAMFSLVGYLFGARTLYTLPWLTIIALQTSTIILALGLGLVFASPDCEPMRTLCANNAAGLLVRRTLPLSILVPIALAFLRVKGQDAGLYNTGMGTAILVLALVAMLTTITWQNAALIEQREQAQRAAEARLRAVIEQLPVGVGVMDHDGCWTISNASIRRLVPSLIPSRDSERRGRWRAFAPDGQPLEPSQWPGARALRGETVDLPIAFVYTNDEGHEIATLASAAPLRDEDGKIIGAISVIQDVRELKAIERERERLRAEVEARAQELQTIFDIAPVQIWFGDAECKTLHGNRRAYEEHGLKMGVNASFTAAVRELPDGLLLEVNGRPLKPEEMPMQVAARTGKPVHHFEHDVVHPDGTRQTLWANVAPLFRADGTLRGVVGVYTDITALKHAERALAEADRRKDQFLATLAHELRGPLAPLRNGLELMKLAGSDVGAVKQARTMMERQLAQMVRLIDDLLDVSRISQGKLGLRKRRVDVVQILEHAVETSRPLIESRGHQLILELPPGPVIVDADAPRLAQVFSNLLNNAGKYSDPGGKICLSVKRVAESIAVTVKDNGFGIPPDMLQSVFEMFTQVDQSLERTHGGLGIGLSLAKALVEMHGGSIDAKSDGVGKGSEFTVHLPSAADLPVEEGGEKPSSRPAKPLRRRILVVDDSQDSASSLARVLRMMANETAIAHDGLEALDLAAEFEPEVILLDIGMPKLNGYDTCRRMREQPWGRNPIIIALTGWGQEEDRRRSQEAGFNYHLVKPVDPDALEELLSTAFSVDPERSFRTGCPLPDPASA
jgi:signal transduction histidine kinase/ActR/RegA family two-component response regulator